MPGNLWISTKYVQEYSKLWSLTRSIVRKIRNEAAERNQFHRDSCKLVDFSSLLRTAHECNERTLRSLTKNQFAKDNSKFFNCPKRNHSSCCRQTLIVCFLSISSAVDSRHLKECIERAEFSLNLELWFGEQQQPQTQQPDATTNGSTLSLSDTNLMLASTRTLQLNFHPGRGLHYHLPVLFDYFHLAAVSLGIHASLIAMHQPYL